MPWDNTRLSWWRAIASIGTARPDVSEGAKGIEDPTTVDMRLAWGQESKEEDEIDFEFGSDSGNDDEATLEEEEVSLDKSTPFVSQYNLLEGPLK